MLSPLAFVVANLLILWSGWDTDWKLGVAILIGYVILASTRMFKLNPAPPPLDCARRSGCRLLLGMGLIVVPATSGR